MLADRTRMGASGGGETPRTEYRYYRLQVKDNNGDSNDLRVADFQITPDGGTTWYPDDPGPMTSNSAPSPLVALASDEDQASKAAWHAFDNNLNVTDAWQPGSPFSTDDEDWVQFDLGSGNAQAADQFRIWATGNTAPRSGWVLGSNDGTNWDHLHWFSDETGWSTESRTFDIAAPDDINHMFADMNGDSSNASSYSISLNCRDGGDMVVCVFGHNANATISSWTLGGETVTIKAEVISSSQTRLAIGTVSGVGSGSQTMSVTFSSSELRCITSAFMVKNANLSTMSQTDTDTTSGFSLSFSAYAADTIVIACAGTGSGTAFTAGSGASWVDNEAAEANFTCSSALGADASTTVAFTGTSSQPATVGVVLSKG